MWLLATRLWSIQKGFEKRRDRLRNHIVEAIDKLSVPIVVAANRWQIRSGVVPRYTNVSPCTRFFCAFLKKRPRRRRRHRRPKENKCICRLTKTAIGGRCNHVFKKTATRKEDQIKDWTNFTVTAAAFGVCRRRQRFLCSPFNRSPIIALAFPLLACNTYFILLFICTPMATDQNKCTFDSLYAS